jgi:hypothetical protein
MFVDWLIDAGNNIHCIDDYDEWLVLGCCSPVTAEAAGVVKPGREAVYRSHS